jgi:hypothetical protein
VTRRGAFAGAALAALLGGCNPFSSSELTIHNRTAVPVLVLDQGAPAGSHIVVDACSSARYRFGASGWTRIDPPPDGAPDPSEPVVVSIQAMPQPDSTGSRSTWIITNDSVSGADPAASLPPCSGVPPTPTPA